MIRSLSGFARRCTKSTARTSRASSCTGRARGDAHVMQEIRRDGLGTLTPEARYFLDKAHRLLGEPDAVLTIGLNNAAGRTAYLAGFHAAQAFIA